MNMNSSVLRKNFNTKYFLIALVFSIGMVAGSIWFMKEIFAGDAGRMTASARACNALLIKHEFKVMEPTPSTLKATKAGTKGIEDAVLKSGVIIANCPAYKLTEYCAGPDCKLPGVSLTLTKK